MSTETECTRKHTCKLSSNVRKDSRHFHLGEREQRGMGGGLFGQNIIQPSPLKSYWSHVCEALWDPTMIMLIAAAIVSFGLSFAVGEDYIASWVESGAILMAVGIVVNVAASTEHFKEREFRRLFSDLSSEIRTTVRRGGKAEHIPVAEVEILLQPPGHKVLTPRCFQTESSSLHSPLAEGLCWRHN